MVFGWLWYLGSAGLVDEFGSQAQAIVYWNLFLALSGAAHTAPQETQHALVTSRPLLHWTTILVIDT